MFLLKDDQSSSFGASSSSLFSFFTGSGVDGSYLLYVKLWEKSTSSATSINKIATSRLVSAKLPVRYQLVGEVTNTI